MPKKKMKFPEVPGDTPREQFINLVRHVLSVPKDVVELEHSKGRTKRHKKTTI
jgi:uncharacterized protein YggU (UPF0235/DUF167 family)